MLGVQLKDANAGHRFNLAHGVGMMLYNNNGANLEKGDVVVVGADATYRWIAVLPCDAVASVYHDLAVVMETIRTGTIGKVALWGDGVNDDIEVYLNSDSTNGAGAIAAGDYLECIPASFDGTVGNTAFVAGSGSTRDTITDSDSGLVTDDFVAGQFIIIQGATTAANNGRHQLYSVVAGTLTLTSIGAVTAEAGATGYTIKAVGQLEKDGTSRTVTSVGRTTTLKAAVANTSAAAALVKYGVIFPNTNTVAAR